MQLLQKGPMHNALIGVSGVFAVRDLLCCDSGTFSSSGEVLGCMDFVLGFDLGAGEWKLVVGDDNLSDWDQTACRSKCACPIELRPDLFLD